MFGKRFHLVTVNQISIGFDASWFFIAILLTWTLAAGYFPYAVPELDTLSYFLMGLLGMLGLFLSIVLHELGHALTAKRFGLPISRITLFLFGGVAELDRDPPSPKVEFLVAVAGPVVSVILALVFILLANGANALSFSPAVVSVFSYLAVINLVVVAFNLIPAFPLDGGRIFRSFLWWAKGSLQWATKVSSRMGYAFGFFLILLGFLSFLTGSFIAGLWWIILGLFLQQAASMSETQVCVKGKLAGDKVERYMVDKLDTVEPDITIDSFVHDYVYDTYHHLYPVVKVDQLFGYVSLEDVKKTPKEMWNTTRVLDILVPIQTLPTVCPKDDILKALALFQKTDKDTLLVVENGFLVGLLTAGDLSRIISRKLELEE